MTISDAGVRYSGRMDDEEILSLDEDDSSLGQGERDVVRVFGTA